MKRKASADDLMEHLVEFFGLPFIGLDRTCKLVEKDHREDARVFAHAFHRKGRVVCVSKAFDKLPLEHQIGILLHEIGHVMSKGGEAEADLWVQENLGIDIQYRDTLQWASAKKVGL